MLLVEDLLLLLTEDATGRTLVDSATLDLALAGGVLLELAARGRADLSQEHESVRPGRVVVRDVSPTGDPLLDAALARLLALGPQRPVKVLHALRPGLTAEVRRRLVERGVLRHEEGRALGIFPTHRWPAVDSRHEEHVRRALREVLVTRRAPTGVETAILAILVAVDRVHQAVPATGLSSGELRKRARALAGAGFVSEAVRRAVEEVQAALIASVTAATAAAATTVSVTA